MSNLYLHETTTDTTTLVISTAARSYLRKRVPDFFPGFKPTTDSPLVRAVTEAANTSLAYVAAALWEEMLGVVEKGGAVALRLYPREAIEVAWWYASHLATYEPEETSREWYVLFTAVEDCYAHLFRKEKLRTDSC